MGFRQLQLSPTQKVTFQLPWLGGKLRSSPTQPIAFDTETEVVEKGSHRIPWLVLCTVSDGRTHAVLKPQQLPLFLKRHAKEHFVIHNSAFDFWVVDNFLRDGMEVYANAPEGKEFEEAHKLWWDTANETRLHDSMLLDMLLRLAAGDGEFGADSIFPRNLAKVCKDYGGMDVDKEDPYRTRFAEIMGKNWEDFREVEPGFFEYAIRDVLAPWLAYPHMVKRAVELANHWQVVPQKGAKTFEMFPGAWKQWGPLTEAIQVKGAIALADIGRRGIKVDLQLAEQERQKYLAEVEGLKDWFLEHYPKMLQFDKHGNIKLTPKSKVPRLNAKYLLTVLEEEAARLNIKPPKSKGKGRTAKDGTHVPPGTSRALADWEDYVGQSEFIARWSRLAFVSRHLGFFDLFTRGGELHPDYRVLLRTGRVSSTEPNLLAIPRDPKFRELFIARTGSKMFTVDYSYIELRTLAAICLARFGHSELADVIKRGIDPHVNSAAMLQKMSPEEFAELKAKDAKRYKEDRQAAKAANFGIPGGLGATKLAAYAKATYDVDMTIEEAAEFRERLTEEIYTELSSQNGYLKDDGLQDLSRNLGLSLPFIRRTLQCFNAEQETITSKALVKIVRGEAVKENGEPYKASYCDKMWHKLKQLCDASTKLPTGARSAVYARQPSVELYRQLFAARVVTLTGRIRGGVRYTQKRNTGFQGLAADGAKLAMFELIRRGFKPVVMVHDEYVVELPEGEAEEQAKEVEHILCEQMESVLGGLVPVACEGVIADYWKKG